MKKSKIIIPALAMLVMSTAATVTGTVAWFSMNKTVTAEGMLVRAQGQGSIIITKYNASDSTNKGRPQTSDKTTGVNFADSSAYGLYPSTHDLTETDPGTLDYQYGLKYVSNGNMVCYETGTAKKNIALTYTAVTTNVNYFKDYDIFIGGDGQTFDNHHVDITFGTLDSYENINKAISIDFYAEVTGETATVDEDHYVGTLNVAGQDISANNGNTPKTSIRLSNTSIPVSGSNTSLAIKMRVYYDGGLVSQAGSQAYTSYTQVPAVDPEDVAGTTKTVANYPDAKYFYNAGGDILLDRSNTSAQVNGMWVVNRTASRMTFARSVDYELLEDVALNVVFTAEANS